MNNPSSPSPGWALWPAWVAANTAAVLGGFALSYAGIAATRLFVPDLNEDRVFVYFIVPSITILFGALQWLVIRPFLRRSAWWLLATSGGILAGGLLALLGWQAASSLLDVETPIGPNLFFAWIGLFLGLSQWLILRRQVSSAGWWVPVIMLSGLAAMISVGQSINNFFEMGLIGAVPAILSGPVLVVLLRSRIPV